MPVSVEHAPTLIQFEEDDSSISIQIAVSDSETGSPITTEGTPEQKMTAEPNAASETATDSEPKAAPEQKPAHSAPPKSAVPAKSSVMQAKRAPMRPSSPPVSVATPAKVATTASVATTAKVESQRATPLFDIPIEISRPENVGNIALPPPEERKADRPSPSVISEITARAALAKSRVGISGPTGDAAARAQAVIAACEAELGPTVDKTRAARLHFEIAQCGELYFADEAKALFHYQKSIEFASDFIPSIRGARRILTAQKSWPSVLKLLDSEIDLESDGKYKALLHCVKGRIIEDFLHQQSKARQSYQKAEELLPGSPEVIEALLQSEQKAKNWPGLIPLLERAADAVALDSKYRAALIAERARLLDTRTKNPAAAAETYTASLRLNPDGFGVTAPLKRLLYSQSRWSDLISLWERDVLESKDTAAKASALLYIGRLYADKQGDRAKAVEALERAYRIEPTNLLILENLVSNYELMGSPERLINGLERLSKAALLDHQRVPILHRIAELFEKQLQDPAQAVAWYEEALRLSPAHLPSLRAIAGLYERLGRFDALCAMHLAEAANTDNSVRRADAHVRAAEIFEYRLGRPGDAASHHALALALVPGLETSFKALVRLYSQAGQYKPLIDLYENAADQARDEDTAFTYLFKIGAIFEDAVGRPDLAVDVYLRILKRSPRHLGAIHAIERTAEVSGRFGDLFDALKTEADLIKDPKRHVELLQAAAQTADEKLQNTDEALLGYKKVLEVDPAYPPTLAALGRLYAKLGRWSDLLDIYARELKGADSKESKVSLLVKMAEVCAYTIGDDDSAIRHYRKAQEIDPTNALVLHALGIRLEHRGDFDTLVTVIQAEIDNTNPPLDRARAAVRLGEVHEFNRKDLVRAGGAYRRAMEDAPSYKPAVDGFTRTCAALGNWADLAEQLIKGAETAQDPKVQVEYLLEAGIVLNDHLGDAKRAIQVLESVLVKDGTNVAALMALTPLLREASAWQKLIEVHFRLASQLQDAGQKASVLKELARLVEAHGDTADLRRALLSLLTIDPGDPTVLSQLEQIGARQQDWPLLSEVDVQQAASATVPEIAAVYLARLGQSLESTAPNEAVEAYNGASAFDPNGLFALRAMASIGEKTSNIDVQIPALKKEAEWTKSAKNAADLLVHCADLRLRAKRDVQGAVHDLSQALYRCPEHVEAAERVVSLLTSVNQLELLVEIISRAAEMTRDPARKAEYWGTAAKLRHEGLNDISGAVGALSRMLSAQPTHVPTMLHLVELYKLNRQWDEAAKTLERAAKQRPPRKQLIDIHLELARIADSHLQNTAMAVTNIEALLQLDPNHAEALQLLSEIHLNSGNLDQAVIAAERLLKTADDPESRAFALFCTARIRFKKNAKKPAAKFFREAVALAGPRRMAAPEYLSMLGTDESWEDYLSALIEFQKVASETPSNEENLIDTIAEIARVQHEGLGQAGAAVATLERALSVLGNSRMLRFELAKRLAAADQLSKSASELRRLMAEEPFRPELWRLLSQVFRAEGREAEARIAVQPLSIIGGASQDEQRQIESFDGPTIAVEPNSFNRTSLLELTPRVAGLDAITGLLDVLSDALAKAYNVGLDTHGLSPRDRLADSHPLRILTNTLQAAFGTDGHDLYVSRTATEIMLELTEPVSIIVPYRLNGSGRSTQLFALGRVFAYIARQQHPVLKLGQSETALALAAVTQKFSSALIPGMNAEALERTSKRVFKAVSWRQKKSVEEAAQLLASTPGVDLGRCLLAMESAAVRAGAILSSDLSAVLEEIKQSAALKPSQSALMHDLLAFWVSESAFNLRHKAKLI
jgi:tetratricopeptide (TPR) repeat protein